MGIKELKKQTGKISHEKTWTKQQKRKLKRKKLNLF